jgi:hypothetical protein
MLEMFAKLRIILSIFGLLGILAACSPVAPVDSATALPSKVAESTSPPPSPSTTGSDPSPAPLLFDCQEIQEIPLEECQALVALYEVTSGDNWADNSGWLVDHTPCTWLGVICEQGHVVELQLYYNQLSGTLPPEIGNLTHLKSLYLDDNELSGPVPSEIGNLAQLQVARLGRNQFSSSIPAELTNLTDLIFLELWGNQLSGEIPGELGNLSVLQVLKLDFNQFTGGIPPELGSLTNLHQLDLSHNQLTRSIPAALGDLAVLNQLDLSHNQLTGSIPTELGNLNYLYWLDLSYNELTGVVPGALANSPIAELRLWGSLLEGTILVSEGTTPVEHGGVRFEVNSALAESVWREIVTPRPLSPAGPSWDVWPEHVRFTIAGPREQSDLESMRVGVAAQPQIIVYPVQEFRTMSEPASAEIESLQSLLESRPSEPENQIPRLPLINAAQVFHAQVKYLDFQNGSGVRFITQYSQDVTPIVNQHVFYTFQGLTQDGTYYVSAHFPIRTAALSDELEVKDWDAFSAGYQDYLVETVRDLNALPSNEFEPDLELLDSVIQSLAVNPP